MASPSRRLWGQAGLLEGVGDHGRVGEQVGTDLAEGGELLGPVAGGVGFPG